MENTDALGFTEDFVYAPPPGQSRKASRYIFFPGDVMADSTKRSAEHLFLGGDYYGHDYPSLAITNGLLNRCRITPVTVRPRPMSSEETIVNPHELEIMEVVGATNARIRLVKTFPNDSVNAIVYSESNLNGKVELTALRGMEYLDEDGRIIAESHKRLSAIQQHFFPNWAKVLTREEKLPDTLREIEALIQSGIDRAKKDETLISIGEEMLGACDRFRVWGLNELEKEANRVRAGLHSAGYTHSYSAVAVILLRQLEIERETFTGRRANENNNNNQQLSDAIASLAATQKAVVEMQAAQMAKVNPQALSKKDAALQAKAEQPELTAA